MTLGSDSLKEKNRRTALFLLLMVLAISALSAILAIVK